MGFWRDMQDQLPEGAEVIEPSSTPMQDRVDAEFEQMSETTNVLSDVEKRLHKANLYRLILENPLIEANGDPLAAEVEKEIRSYVIDMLQSLMGIKSELRLVSGNIGMAARFSEEEIKALKLWAAKLLAKPSVMKIEPKVNASKPPQAPQASATLKPLVAPAGLARRGPGRPPGSKKQVDERSGRKKAEVELPNGQKAIVDVTPAVKPMHAQPVPMPSPEVALAMGMAQSMQQSEAAKGLVGLAIGHFTGKDE